MNLSGLLPHQPPAADQLLSALSRHSGALDGSELGTGKTYAAGAVIRERDVPTLVVCPLISVASWQRMGVALGVEFSIINYEQLRIGKSPFGQWEFPKVKSEPFFKCQQCQCIVTFPNPAPCVNHHLGIHCIESKTKPHNYGKFFFNSNIKQLVVDEVHRCSALDSLQADMYIASKRQRIPTLGLSATAGTTPLDFRALGFSLGLHHLLDFYPWAMRHGCRKVPWGGFEFAVGAQRQKQIMADLHAEIFPERGARVRIEDLGAAFPEVQITAELYDIKEAGRIDKLYAQMDSAIQSLNEQRLLDKCAEHPLTVLLRASEEIELLLLPVFHELVIDQNASGYSTATFLNFRRSVNELCRMLKTECRVDGSQVGIAGSRRRQANLDNFQANRERNIVLSAAAGNASIDLHDVHGGFPRVGNISPGYSALVFRQICGRLRRSGGKSKALYRVVLAAGTVQTKIHKALSAKLNCMDALTDGDLFAANLPLLKCELSDIFRPEYD